MTGTDLLLPNTAPLRHQHLQRDVVRVERRQLLPERS